MLIICFLQYSCCSQVCSRNVRSNHRHSIETIIGNEKSRWAHHLKKLQFDTIYKWVYERACTRVCIYSVWFLAVWFNSFPLHFISTSLVPVLKSMQWMRISACVRARAGYVCSWYCHACEEDFRVDTETEKKTIKNGTANNIENTVGCKNHQWNTHISVPRLPSFFFPYAFQDKRKTDVTGQILVTFYLPIQVTWIL